MDEMHKDRVGSAGGDKSEFLSDAAHLSSGIWQETRAVSGKFLEQFNKAAGSQALPELDLNNQWHFDRAVKPGLDRITTRAAVPVAEADFNALNPGVNPAAGNLPDLRGDKGFKVRHATTGEVDGGWKLDSVNKDGSLSLTKDYSLQVESKARHNGLIETLPGVPPGHTKALENKLAQLPAKVLQALKDRGYKIIATPSNTDALPELKGKTPRGWTEDSTFDNSDGTHDNVRRLILAPYKYMEGNEWRPVGRPEVLVHQIAHALDHSYGKLSNDPEFQQAFRQDMQKLAARGSSLSEHEKMIYDYFNQKENLARGERPGSEEAFASLFGMILTGPENPEDRPFFQANFANTVRVVRRQIGKL